MPKQARASATQERIFVAFWSEVARIGYPKVTLDRVIKKAAVSKGSFYHHFRNKHHLFQCAYRAHTDRTRQHVERVFAQGQTVEDTIIGDVMRVIRELPDRRMIVAVLELDLVAMRDPSMRVYHAEDYATKRKLTERLIAEGIRRGELRADIDVPDVARFIYTSIFGVYLLHFSAGETDDVAGKVERCLRMLFAGLRQES